MIDKIKYAEGGLVVGDYVNIVSDNKMYDDYRNERELMIESISDDGEGETMYELEDVPFSFYEYELEKVYAKGGKIRRTRVLEYPYTSHLVIRDAVKDLKEFQDYEYGANRPGYATIEIDANHLDRIFSNLATYGGKAEMIDERTYAKGGTTKTQQDFLNKWEEEQRNYYEYYDIDELERDYRDFLGKEPSKKLTKDDLINALIKEELKTIKSDSKYELKERIDDIREKSGAESNAEEDDDYYSEHPDWQLYEKGGMVNKIIGIAKTQEHSTDTESFLHPISANVPPKFLNEVGFKLENKNDTVMVLEIYFDTKEIVLQGYVAPEGENYEDIEVYKLDDLSDEFQKWIVKNLIMQSRYEKGKTRYAKGGLSPKNPYDQYLDKNPYDKFLKARGGRVLAKGGKVKKVEKKQNNELIVGGLAGVLLGIFLNR